MQGFDGPAELLLQLVNSQEVDLYEISLVELVDAYLKEIEQAGRIDLEPATGFLLVAATLVEMKVRGLLPKPEAVEMDEELARWETRDLLLARLLEATTFREAVLALERLASRASRSHARQAGIEERFVDAAPDLLAGVTPERLRAALVKALTPKPEPRVSLEHVTPIRASVADAIDELVDILSSRGRATFRVLTAGVDERIQIIVRFLALLELFKQGFVELEQLGRFGDLEVSWTAQPELVPVGAGWDLTSGDEYASETEQGE
jgi:segregation and condensation protein A